MKEKMEEKNKREQAREREGGGWGWEWGEQYIFNSQSDCEDSCRPSYYCLSEEEKYDMN